ncbi:hypothetical protein SmJEL517_g04961 [Synchytrium microbalum]|uniref:Conserved oligomeric Golgi complex subunit 8 n=1 Tax=Synchytrium microbalum TaxID=1806994 RepID=A0A507BP63_9FUNG|nr:uncharacterized protein SmJEL517_g04961 [Synchytrium microbalum]TPX31800.1 hypothetical protein SmJEL517_g04961 [Synchytrium microbalum]
MINTFLNTTAETGINAVKIAFVDVATSHGHGFLIGLLIETANQSTSTHLKLDRPIFRDPDVAEYVDSLTAQTLSSLLSLPAKLASESASVDAQLSELAYSEYKSFLTSSTCEEDVLRGFDNLDSHLEKLDASFPSLEASCNTFSENATSTILTQKAVYATLLNKHGKLLELLEIPQLAETFVRSGYYEEAMDLYTYVMRLSARHPQSKLIIGIGEEVETIKRTMVQQLVKLLSANVKLPLCIRVVGYLRRLSVYSEVDLRILFLQQRDAFLRSMLHELNGERDSGEFLRRYIEISREYFFDIVAQYRAIFSDTPISTSSSLPPLTPTTPSSLYGSSHGEGETQTSTSTILSSYAAHAVSTLVTMLTTHLANIRDTSRLSSLLTQCMYYGMSLGRVGIDFRMVVGKLFEDAVQRIIEDEVNAGVDRFERMIQDLGEKGLTTKTAVASTTSDGKTGTSRPSTTPPASLLSHPPLAHLINAYFAAYNQLRLLAPMSLIKPISSLVNDSLISCAGLLAKFGDERRSKWTIEERSAHHIVCKAFMDGVALPAKAGLELVYKDRNVAIELENVASKMGSWGKDQRPSAASAVSHEHKAVVKEEVVVREEIPESRVVSIDEPVTNEVSWTERNSIDKPSTTPTTTGTTVTEKA